MRLFLRKKQKNKSKIWKFYLMFWTNPSILKIESNNLVTMRLMTLWTPFNMNILYSIGHIRWFHFFCCILLRQIMYRLNVCFYMKLSLKLNGFSLISYIIDSFLFEFNYISYSMPTTKSGVVAQMENISMQCRSTS